MPGPDDSVRRDSTHRPTSQQPQQEVDYSALSPLGGSGPIDREAIEREVDDGGSVFDDDDEEEEALLGELTDADPNVTDNGTEILKVGRAELQEFHEQFLKGAASKRTESPPNSDQT